MTADNEKKLEERIKALEQRIADGENDKLLVRELARLLIDMLATNEGRQHKMIEKVRGLLKGLGDEG